MRIWSIHPQYLDPQGLVALWREGLLAQKVLRGETKGYTKHPQLHRFHQTPDPTAAIQSYLYYVWLEAKSREYKFDRSKISKPEREHRIVVPTGQLEYEREHLLKKITARSPKHLKSLPQSNWQAHPLVKIIPGGIATWEVRN